MQIILAITLPTAKTSSYTSAPLLDLPWTSSTHAFDNASKHLGRSLQGLPLLYPPAGDCAFGPRSPVPIRTCMSMNRIGALADDAQARQSERLANSQPGWVR